MELHKFDIDFKVWKAHAESSISSIFGDDSSQYRLFLTQVRYYDDMDSKAVAELKNAAKNYLNSFTKQIKEYSQIAQTKANETEDSYKQKYDNLQIELTKKTNIINTVLAEKKTLEKNLTGLNLELEEAKTTIEEKDKALTLKTKNRDFYIFKKVFWWRLIAWGRVVALLFVFLFFISYNNYDILKEVFKSIKVDDIKPPPFFETWLGSVVTFIVALLVTAFLSKDIYDKYWNESNKSAYIKRKGEEFDKNKEK
ncbi:hypothetical protein [Bernardetia sp. MNP-M8]|uniref:hypothetical protein n=1 Tax=Bernardetia sp. MNP-M8 TaxID=3127470 RepID=UPI0030CD12B0